MKVTIALFLAGIVTISMVAGVMQAAEPQTKTGTVKKVDTEAKNIVVMVTREMTFKVTDDTKIVKADAPVKLADIKVGDEIIVTYTREGTGDSATRTASKIVIKPKSEEKK